MALNFVLNLTNNIQLQYFICTIFVSKKKHKKALIMKNYVNLLISGLLMASFFFVMPAQADHHEEEKKTQETEINVEGMSCGNCAAKIDKKLSEEEGISKIETSFSESSSKISFDSEKVTEKELSDLIEDLGFEVVKEQSGKTCSSDCSKDCCA